MKLKRRRTLQVHCKVSRAPKSFKFARHMEPLSVCPQLIHASIS